MRKRTNSNSFSRNFGLSKLLYEEKLNDLIGQSFFTCLEFLDETKMEVSEVLVPGK